MATEGAALVENHAGITFGVELYVPWDAPEAACAQRSYHLARGIRIGYIRRVLFGEIFN